ncbi:hypothetical protein BT69DRAFT_1355544 [Atractiella rhizophila]|nr:hypothetical protein BT69DRAFT_1355544 [Atractiella rhizophila]
MQTPTSESSTPTVNRHYTVKTKMDATEMKRGRKRSIEWTEEEDLELEIEQVSIFSPPTPELSIPIPPQSQTQTPRRSSLDTLHPNLFQLQRHNLGAPSRPNKSNETTTPPSPSQAKAKKARTLSYNSYPRALSSSWSHSNSIENAENLNVNVEAVPPPSLLRTPPLRNMPLPSMAVGININRSRSHSSFQSHGQGRKRRDRFEWKMVHEKGMDGTRKMGELTSEWMTAGPSTTEGGRRSWPPVGSVAGEGLKCSVLDY